MNASSNADDTKILEFSIEEQRRFHDELTSSYRSLQLKIISFIGAALALLAFLYSGATDTSAPTAERLFIPAELYGVIFYFIGLGSLLFALAKLIHGARPNGVWTVPLDLEQLEKLELNERSETQYLTYYKDEYVKATRANLKQHAKKHEAIRDSFYPLLIGAIVLIVLRYFQ